MAIDLISNIEGWGDTADKLIANNFDVGVLRPWIGKDGKSYICRTINGQPKVMTTNTPATLTRDAWIQFDQSIQRAIQERLSAFADIRRAGLVYNLPNGMAHTVLQYQTQGDITPATISMDPVRRSERDRPHTDVENLPLPIVHKDFDFSAREIMSSRLGQMPIDTTTAELAAIKVAEEVEKMTVGTVTPFTYGGGSVYGYMTLPERALKINMTVPTGANGPTVIGDLLALRQLLIDDRHYGPYVLYLNSQWAQVLDNDFSTAKGDQTLRQRILTVAGIQKVEILYTLPTTKWHALLVELSSQTVRAVVGMEVQTIQWESLGGMMKHFKVMCMLVPQIRSDTDGNSGVAHGTTS